MRLRGFDLTRAQRGWVCEVCFTVFTVNQCSAEEHVIRSGGRWILSAMWNGFWDARRTAMSLAAKPGERKKLGWG